MSCLFYYVADLTHEYFFLSSADGENKKGEKRESNWWEKGKGSAQLEDACSALRNFPATFLTFTSNNTFCEAVRWFRLIVRNVGARHGYE